MLNDRHRAPSAEARTTFDCFPRTIAPGAVKATVTVFPHGTMSQPEQIHVLVQDRIVGLLKGLGRLCGRSELTIMLRIRSIVSAFVFSYSALQAQNLVPNPSFEEHVLCPYDWSQLSDATSWLPFRFTPDYFNACDQSGVMSIPSNRAGYQVPATGSAYAGVLTYIEPDVVPDPEGIREFIGAPLSEVLVPGLPVNLSFKVALGGYGNFSQSRMKWTCKGIGMGFSTYAMSNLDQPPPLTNRSALHLDYVLTDTSDWAFISGTYIPDSAYAFVIIGNFYSDSLVEATVLDSDGTAGFAYMFIDDVCVSMNAQDCTLSIGVQELLPTIWNAGADPVGDQLHIRFGTEQAEEAQLTLVDVQGRVCLRSVVMRGSNEWTGSIAELPAGLYLVHLESRDRSTTPTRIIHVK